LLHLKKKNVWGFKRADGRQSALQKYKEALFLSRKSPLRKLLLQFFASAIMMQSSTVIQISSIIKTHGD
jgi:hypothetical protein